MAEEEEDNYIEIEDDEEGDDNQVSNYKLNKFFILQEGGMNIDLNQAMKACEGIEKVQERTNAGVVS